MIIRLLIIATVVLFLVFWVRAVIDVFRRRPDLTRSAQAAWMIGMLIFPFIGLLVYEMLRPSDQQLHRRHR